MRQLNGFIIVLGMFTISNDVSAETYRATKPWNHSLKYKETPLSSHKSVTINQFGKRLEKFGYYLLPEVKSKKNPLSSVDAIFSNEKFNKAIFLRFGVTPKGKNLDNVIMQDMTDKWVYHGVTKKNENYALYFRGFKRDEVSQILDQVEIVAQDDGPTQGNRAPASEAFDVSDTGSGTRSGVLETARSTAVGLPYFVYGCVKGVLDGTTAGSVGVAVESLKKWRHPISLASEYWNGINAAWDSQERFSAAFLETVNKTYANFSEIDAQTRGKVFCKVVSTIFAGSLVTFATVGLGTPGLVEKIKEALRDLEGEPEFEMVLRPRTLKDLQLPSPSPKANP